MSTLQIPTLQIQTARVFKPLLQPARYKGAYGGRNSGKSWFFAAAIIWMCLTYPGLRVVCIRETMLSLRESAKRLIEDTIIRYGVGDSFEVLNTVIRTPGNGVIIFQGMQAHNAESIKSLEGYDIAYVEEAQTLSQTSLDLLRPTLRKPGSELWFSWNPRRRPTERTKGDPVDVFFRSGEKPPNAIVVNANFYNNPWMTAEMRTEMEYDKRRDPDKYQHIWLGGYEQSSEARVFRNWRIGTCGISQGNRPYFGADWGFSIDPTVLVRAWVFDRTVYLDKEAYGIGVGYDDTPRLFEKGPGRADAEN